MRTLAFSLNRVQNLVISSCAVLVLGDRPSSPSSETSRVAPARSPNLRNSVSIKVCSCIR